MAVAVVHVFEEIADERATRLVRAVCAALVEVLRVPANEPTVWLETHPAARAILADRHGPGFVHVRVTMFAGRTLEMKRDLHRQICVSLQAAGVAAGSVLIVLEELPVTSWSIAGQMEQHGPR